MSQLFYDDNLKVVVEQKEVDPQEWCGQEIKINEKENERKHQKYNRRAKRER